MADRNGRPLTTDDIKAICSREIESAKSFVEPLSSARMRQLDYYHGKQYGDEKPGQSRVVTREVLDTVEWILPSLLEIFASTDETVRFDPVGPEDVPFAEQATDYVNLIWNKDNPGFLNLHTWFKDALLSTVGVLKIWWEVDEETRSATFEGLDDMQLQMVMDDPSIEILGVEPLDVPMALPAPQPDPMQPGLPAPAGPTFWNVSLRWREPRGRVCVEPVPPEEYIFLGTVKRDTDPGQGHIRRVTQGDLIAQGFDPAVVDDLPTSDDDDNGERSHRFDASFDDDITRSTQDRASRFVTVTEWYTRIDRDGDGVAEPVKVTLGGDTHGKVLAIEDFDQPPFAVLSPILMPHKLAGLSVAELVMDLQEIKSSLTRQMLNSLYLSNNPRVWAVDGQVNLDDLLTHRPGGVVRMRQPGMVGELNTTFVGGQAFPFLEYIDRTLEGRTGVSRMMQGMDADILNGGGNKAMQTATGVAALQSAAQQRVALIARVFAETGVKKAFRLILQLVTKYQDQERVVRLRNQWVPVDPRAWNSEMDCSIEVGLGSGNKTEQTAHLTNILTIQQQFLGAGGMGLVTPKEIHNTLAKLIQLAGLKQVDAYFTDPAQQPQQPPQPPPPDPNLIAVQGQLQIEQAKLQLEMEKMKRADDRERDKLDADIAIRAAEMNARYGAQVNVANIRAMVDRDREAMRQQASMQQAAMQPQGPVQ